MLRRKYRFSGINIATGLRIVSGTTYAALLRARSLQPEAFYGGFLLTGGNSSGRQNSDGYRGCVLRLVWVSSCTCTFESSSTDTACNMLMMSERAQKWCPTWVALFCTQRMSAGSSLLHHRALARNSVKHLVTTTNNSYWSFFWSHFNEFLHWPGEGVVQTRHLVAERGNNGKVRKGIIGWR